jgi:hypothetical protein
MTEACSMTASNSRNNIYSRNAFNIQSRKDRTHKDTSTLITSSNSADGIIIGNNGGCYIATAGTPPTAGKAHGFVSAYD